MTMYEVDAIIDKLCEKLGTAKEMLVPELSRMCSMRHLCNSVFCVIAIVVIAMILCHCGKIIKNHNDYDFDTIDNAEMGTFMCSIVMIGFFIAIWYNVYECIQWIAAPNAKAIEYILTLL